MKLDGFVPPERPPVPVDTDVNEAANERLAADLEDDDLDDEE
jgi:hypothetical protein